MPETLTRHIKEELSTVVEERIKNKDIKGLYKQHNAIGKNQELKSMTNLRRKVSIPNKTMRRNGLQRRSFSVPGKSSESQIIMRMVVNLIALLTLFRNKFAHNSVMTVSTGTTLSQSSTLSSLILQPFLQVARLQLILEDLSNTRLNTVVDITQVAQLTEHNGLQDLLSRAINQLKEIIFRLNNPNTQVMPDMPKIVEHLNVIEDVDLQHPQQILATVNEIQDYLKICIKEQTSQNIII